MYLFLDVTNKRSDVTTFRGALESVMRQHYPHMVGHVAIRLISAPPVCSDSLNILSRQVIDIFQGQQDKDK